MLSWEKEAGKWSELGINVIVFIWQRLVENLPEADMLSPFPSAPARPGGRSCGRGLLLDGEPVAPWGESSLQVPPVNEQWPCGQPGGQCDPLVHRGRLSLQQGSGLLVALSGRLVDAGLRASRPAPSQGSAPVSVSFSLSSWSLASQSLCYTGLLPGCSEEHF